MSKAATAIGLSRQHCYRLRNDDEELARAWDEAVEAGTDVLEDIAFERARDQSDTLTIFLLKGRRPDKYKERTQNDMNLNIKVERVRYSDPAPE